MLLHELLMCYFKQDINSLDESINRWRDIAQCALLELKDLINSPNNAEKNIISKIFDELKV